MSKGLRTIINILVWLAVVSYVVIAISYHDYVSDKENICTGLKVDILDNQQKFVDAEIVSNWVDSLRVPISGVPLNSLDIETIENLLRDKPYVQTVSVYPSINGECVIELSQRNVIFRVISSQGHDFFVDTAGYILNPMDQWQKKVPVFTTDLKLPFGIDKFGKIYNFNDTSCYFLQKLSNFVKVLENDDVLSSLITQVRITGKLKPGYEEIRLVPRIGKQRIILGNLDDIELKLARLKKFYQKTYKDGWFQDASELCFQYGNKIIVKRNTKI